MTKMETKSEMPMKFKPMCLKLVEIKEEAPGTKSYLFDIPEGFSWDEGANIHIAFDDFIGPDGPNKTLVRHLSIMTLQKEGKLGFTTRVPGSGSAYKQRLSNIEIGTEMLAFKPKNELKLARNGRPLVMVSMGVGVATIRPLILAYLADQTGMPKVVNLNVDRGENHIYKKELNVEFPFCVNDWVTSRIELYDHLADYAKERDNQYYIIGSDEFIAQILSFLMERGVDPTDLIIDRAEEIKAKILDELKP
jgi:ferredoxin--NADP+ reductase